MSAPSELFTPDGHSPALAALRLETLGVRDQLVAVRGLLGSLSVDALVQQVRSVFQARAADRSDWGIEKPTHYAHLLGQAGEDPGSAKVWLHQYKPRTGMRRFTELDHNHRDGIVARLLCHGYVARERRDSNSSDSVIVDPDTDWSDVYAQLEEIGDVGYERGDIMSIHPDEIHRLERIAPGTLSLAVRLPVQRAFSVVFRAENGADPQIKPDMAAARNHLLDNLESA